MLNCKYPATGPPYLAVYPAKECWTDMHIIEGIMAGSLVTFLYVATMYISCSVKPYHASLYRWDPIFEAGPASPYSHKSTFSALNLRAPLCTVVHRRVPPITTQPP